MWGHARELEPDLGDELFGRESRPYDTNEWEPSVDDEYRFRDVKCVRIPIQWFTMSDDDLTKEMRRISQKWLDDKKAKEKADKIAALEKELASLKNSK